MQEEAAAERKEAWVDMPAWRRECELVEMGALLISSIEEPDLKAATVTQELDKLAAHVRARVLAIFLKSQRPTMILITMYL